MVNTKNKRAARWGLAFASTLGAVAAACGNSGDEASGGGDGDASGDGDTAGMPGGATGHSQGTGGAAEVLPPDQVDPQNPVPPDGFINPVGRIESTEIGQTPGATLIGKEPRFRSHWVNASPGAHLPKQMYFDSCGEDSESPTFFSSTTLTVEDGCTDSMGWEHPDECGGVLFQSSYGDGAGLEQATQVAHFPECMILGGVAASPDCSTVAVLCRRDTHSTDDDADEITKNSLLTHNASDWMTHTTGAYVEWAENTAHMDELWLYEWPDGDISQEPEKYVVHRALGTLYGRTGLLWGDDGTYGIATRADVYEDPEPNNHRMHSADAFLMLDRATHDYTDRGWDWACGTGHTVTQYAGYNPATQKYAMHCMTDFNADGEQRTGDNYFRVEDQNKTVNDPAQMGENNGYHRNYMWDGGIVGGALFIEPVSDGGWIGVVLGIEGDAAPHDEEFHNAPESTSIGVVRFDEVGRLQGEIVWLVTDAEGVLAAPQLAALGDDRYLFGWGTMHRFDSYTDDRGIDYKAPHQYHVMEIDDRGRVISEQLDLDSDAGWGEWDQMVSLGRGRVAWTYVAPPTVSIENAQNSDIPWDRTAMMGHVYVSSVR